MRATAQFPCHLDPNGLTESRPGKVGLAQEHEKQLVPINQDLARVVRVGRGRPSRPREAAEEVFKLHEVPGPQLISSLPIEIRKQGG
jgi:hypothetical protein